MGTPVRGHINGTYTVEKSLDLSQNHKFPNAPTIPFSGAFTCKD